MIKNRKVQQGNVALQTDIVTSGSFLNAGHSNPCFFNC